jgi:hypothetical protein
MPLVFEEIKNLAKQRIQEKENKTLNKTLTEDDKEQIEFYVAEMEKYVKDYANQGKQRFVYDCSKLKPHVFHALAVAFKEVNRYFFVTTRDGYQELAVEWTGKNEV